MLNVINMQATQSGYYLLHDTFYRIINNIFGEPTLNGSIEYKIVLKLLTVNKCGGGLSPLNIFLHLTSSHPETRTSPQIQTPI